MKNMNGTNNCAFVSFHKEICFPSIFYHRKYLVLFCIQYFHYADLLLLNSSLIIKGDLMQKVIIVSSIALYLTIYHVALLLHVTAALRLTLFKSEP